MSATVIHLDKVSGSAGAPDQCLAEYQFMAYSAVRKNTVPVPCSDWNQLSKTHRIQIQYLNSQPDRSRIYPPANPTDRYATLGFGLAALLALIGIALIVWRFWPRNFKLALGR